MMKNLFYAGCCVTGFSLFQMLGQLTRGFPESRNGAIALAILGFLVIIAFGFSNWCGLWYQSNGYMNKNQTIVGFAPVYVFGTFAIIAVTVGYLIGG